MGTSTTNIQDNIQEPKLLPMKLNPLRTVIVLCYLNKHVVPYSIPVRTGDPILVNFKHCIFFFVWHK